MAQSGEHLYAAIDLKSFYASVECRERGLDPLTTNLVVADESRTEKTICLAVSPTLKAYGIPGRARLFEVVEKTREVNAQRLRAAPGRRFAGESFRDPESYYATLAHETVHWAGAEHRLNRDLSRYHSDRSERAREELIADLGACFVSADLGIVPELEPRADHASYLASWLAVLANDRRFIFSAAAHAQRACAYLHGLQPQAETVPEAA